MEINSGAVMARRRRAMLFLAVGTALGLLAVMAALTLPATDDYQYRLFLRDGFQNFLDMNREHYETYNGRVLVHLGAQVVLYLGVWAFVPVCLVCLTAIPALSALASGERRGALLPVLAVFLPGVLLAPYAVINQGILWVSGFFNYVFPTALLCLMLFLLEDALAHEHPGPWRLLGCAVCAFACGATTEQSGAVAIALAGFFLVRALVRKLGRLVAVLPLAAAAEGIYTIFHSPASSERVSTETELSLATMAENVGKHLSTLSRRLADSPLHALLLASLFLLTGFCVHEMRRTPSRWKIGPFLVLWAVPALLAVASLLLSGTALTVVTTALLCLAGLAAAVLIARGEEAPGLLVLMGLLSQAIILLTESDGGRTTTPYLLTTLAAVSVLTARRLSGGRPAWRNVYYAIMVCAAVLCAVPFIGGMVKNYGVELENRRNIEEARETGVLNYRLDYDYTYTHQKVSLSVWREIFLKGEGLPEDTPIHFYSASRPNVYVNGELFYPVEVTEDGRDYLCADIVRPLGGSTLYAESLLDAMGIFTPSVHCQVSFFEDDGPKHAQVFWTRPDGTQGTVETDYLSAAWLKFYPPEFFETVVGLDITCRDGDYYVTAPEQPPAS